MTSKIIFYSVDMQAFSDLAGCIRSSCIVVSHGGCFIGQKHLDDLKFQMNRQYLWHDFPEKKECTF